MIRIGWVYRGRTAHIIDEETRRSKCNMVSLDKEAAKAVNSGSIVSETGAVESLEEFDEMELRLCDHCEREERKNE